MIDATGQLLDLLAKPDAERLLYEDLAHGYFDLSPPIVWQLAGSSSFGMWRSSSLDEPDLEGASLSSFCISCIRSTKTLNYYAGPDVRYCTISGSHATSKFTDRAIAHSSCARW